MVLATRERWFVDGVLALGTLVQFMPSTCLFRCSLLRYTMCAHPARISAWGRHYSIQAVAFDLLIAFSLIFPPHTRLPLYHHSSCNKIIIRYAGTWVHRRTSFRLLRHAMLAAALISALVLHTRITDHVWDRGHSTVRLIIVVVVVVFIGKRLR